MFVFASAAVVYGKQDEFQLNYSQPVVAALLQTRLRI
jgi:hypothetical protein